VVRVLVVEDDPLLHLLLQDGLHEAGFVVFLVESGPAAIRALEKDASQFGALVTDIRLGEGPDGWEIARHARHLVPSFPVVYMSGYSGGSWTERGVPNSVMIEKPFAIAQLITALNNVLSQLAAGASSQPRFQ
jgi:DNA-binding response OmpR family regulator